MENQFCLGIHELFGKENNGKLKRAAMERAKNEVPDVPEVEEEKESCRR